MTDTIRAHQRIPDSNVPGVSIVLKGALARPVEVYFPEQGRDVRSMDLLVHFHGSNYVAKHAAYHAKHSLILAVVNLGSGSGVYENAFQDKATFPSLIEAVRTSVSEKRSAETEIPRLYLSSFSAGYGAVRAILKNHQSLSDGIILLDGLHTDYVPSRRVLAQGGKLNDEKLKDFVQYARLAAEGKKKLLITHSAIFPGTYASTTETADYLIDALDLRRHPVLKWGPAGMQLLSETKSKGLTVLACAGNTAPDHIDHLHGLPTFLKMILGK
ncbi:MAG: hypothetical protein JSW27_08830 [Phycisphaerales bacterium]|nr:MAG: hypothetical protein JSW27_08830 [Phycisphaerales bacterium]